MSTPHCYDCKREITFDNEHIGRNGKKIPLDPDTHAPHDCPVKKRERIASGNDHLEETQEKNDHGNETFQNLTQEEKHILGEYEETKGKRKLVLRRWFTSNNPDVLTIAVNEFVQQKEGRAGQTYAVWRPDIASMEYGECVYYEAEV